MGSDASISATNPAPLIEATLNGATVTVALTGATFRSGVLPSHFEPVATIPDLTVSSVSGASSGDATAVLTLSFTGKGARRAQFYFCKTSGGTANVEHTAL